MYVAEQKSDEIDDLFYHVMICQLLFVCLFVCLLPTKKRIIELQMENGIECNKEEKRWQTL